MYIASLYESDTWRYDCWDEQPFHWLVLDLCENLFANKLMLNHLIFLYRIVKLEISIVAVLILGFCVTLRATITALNFISEATFYS
jgi:hypothetical protein